MLQNLKKRLKSRKGFSLVELIVVIAIMVILIAMLLPSVVGLIGQATEANYVSTASTLYTTANTALTSNATKKNATSRLDSFKETNYGVKCLKGSVNGSIDWTGVTVYTNPTATAVYCVEYDPGDGNVYVNPTDYTTDGKGVYASGSSTLDISKFDSTFKKVTFDADGKGSY